MAVANADSQATPDQTFDADSVLRRCARQILRAVAPDSDVIGNDGIQPERVSVQTIKQGSEALVMRLKVEGKYHMIKAFNPASDEADLHLEREVNVLKALQNRGLVPQLTAYSDAHKCLIMENIEGETLQTFTTAENLPHVCFRLGTWFRVMQERVPSMVRETDWKSYLSKYDQIFSEADWQEMETELSDLTIEAFTISKNDAYLGNFVRSTEGRLIGIDFETSVLKPVGWDLLLSARTLSNRFPDQAETITRELVSGWGETVGSVPAEAFQRLAHFFATRSNAPDPQLANSQTDRMLDAFNALDAQQGE